MEQALKSQESGSMNNYKYLLKILIVTGLLPWSLQAAKTATLKSLLPNHSKIQFAGDVGFLSASLGYGLFGDKLEFDIHYGFTPEFYSGLDVHTISYKSVWIPIFHPLNSNYYWKPLTFAGSVNTTFSNNHDIILAKRTRAYYFPSGLTTSLYAGSRVGLKMNEKSKIHQVEIYSEMTILIQNTTNYYRNDFVKLQEVISLDLGTSISW